MRTAPPYRLEPRANAVRDQYLCGLRPRRLWEDSARRPGRGGDLDEERGDAADHTVGDRTVVDVLGGGTGMQRDRRVLQRLGAESFDEATRRQDERVAWLDALTPHVRQDVSDAAQRLGLARRSPMDEVREFSRFVAG